MSISYPEQARVMEDAHRKFLSLVSDAYLFYLVSKHRRPIFRHQYGDISFNQAAMHGFIDSYLEEKGWSIERRSEWYLKIIDVDSLTEKVNSEFIDWGTVPALTPRGIRWLNACFSRLGEMVNSFGGWDNVVADRKVNG